MQRKSIHNLARTENAQSQNPFPTSGDNFTTVINLDGATDLKDLNGAIDLKGLVEAIDFLEDCQAALAKFKQEKQRTGTPETP